MNDPARDDSPAIAATRRWVDRAVIGLDLCPFARAVQTGNRIRYVESGATTPEALAEDLQRELLHLADADPTRCETTLLVHPHVLADFLDFNDFLDVADALLEELELEGVIQVASFHPQYQFADSTPAAIENYTNRSPHPTLHLLRESSIERAVDAMDDTAGIYEKNVETLRRIGLGGWQRLWQDD